MLEKPTQIVTYFSQINELKKQLKNFFNTDFLSTTKPPPPPLLPRQVIANTLSPLQLHYCNR